MSGSCGCGCGGHDERHAPKALYNAPGQTALNYRVGEYGSFLAAMLDRLASPAYPALRGLTVRTPDDPSVGLLDAWAVVGDLLTFHSERIADEGYLRTADEHRSLALLGRLVGHRPRPGIAADTHLAYTLDRDPRAEDVPVLIPRGARANSVPSTSDEESQAFETSEDLIARWAWNELAVRRRRPALLTPDDLRKRPEIFVSGTGTSLQTGDRLLFVFGGDKDIPGQRLLLPVARIRIDRDDEVTAIGLPQSAPASLTELVAELREWITEDQRETEEGEPTPDNPNPRPVSRIIEDFDAQVLAPLRADLGAIKTPAQFAARLVEPHDRLAEAQAIAAPYEEVAAWFEQLEAVVGELIERAADLEPSRPDTPATASNSPAMQALGAVLPALRTGVVRPPSGARTLSHDPGRYFAPGSDLGAQLLSALDPRVADGMYAAWRRAAPAVPALLRDLQAMRVTATPFGATAPLKPVQDERGRVVRQTDWPLTGGALTAMRVVFDTAGRVPVSAEFQHIETGASVQVAENLPAEKTFPLGPGRISLMTRSAQDHDLSWLSRRPADSQEPGVTVRLMSGLPERTLFVSRPGDDGRVHVAVHNGEPLERFLAPGEHQQIRHGGYEVTLRYTVGSEPANVEVGIATVPEQANRHVVALDSVYDGITVGSWVAIERPRKGADAPDGIPGDEKLKFVTSRVTAVRTAAYTNYGITGRGTELTLAEPWLDEHDVLLSAIRDATVHAGGEALRPADEPLGEDVHGNELELAELYDGLRPGRHLMVSGERTDIPDTAGVRGTELVVIAAVEQQLDPQLPGDHVHTKLTLTTDLAFRYRRDTLRIHGNVVPATHGESRDEPIGSGDAGRTNQTFTLWQAPLTWLPAGNPLGATPTLEVRVDGLLWHEVDSLAGRGPRERVYVSGTAGDGRTTVTFGDGKHGARLPTGHENVRAQYRFGTGRAANVGADRITQAMTRPLGVTAVTNPQPATGGAEADGPGLTRRTIPLAVSALDRLVSLTDYEDFARSRAGIGRAAAREIFDGRRRILHVTVAGIDDIAIADDSEVLRALRSSLADYGDSRLPVRVDVRELVLLLLAAKVKVAPDHTWTVVEPRLRQALLTQFGSGRRELGRPARLSEVLATAHAVPGVDYVDVDVFTGVPASVTPDELAGLAETLARPRTAVRARLAAYDEDVHRVTADDGETLTQVAARYGIPLAELLRLNPDITDTRRLEKDRTVFVFRGIRPAQLALLSPHIADTLILTEVTA
ncbi:putative baseplate assembly protein [Streptomyces sp. NBC_01637]|uniref:putative baseplate assembly protein n=1 Tax=unclassified Streptomyces TaxID=2593676 RepID=UPI00386BF2C6|nr:putative baseplate assembly protein [Streptomyces sp. NBC_01653]WTD91895.1 putative baseplate assembly protein [Streptomyces sp. NBC_01637]